MYEPEQTFVVIPSVHGVSSSSVLKHTPQCICVPDIGPKPT